MEIKKKYTSPFSHSKSPMLLSRKQMTTSYLHPLCNSKLDSSIKLKQLLLQEQSFRARKASFNLQSHRKAKQLLNIYESTTHAYKSLQERAAIKIQKVVRGSLTRKMLSLEGVDVKKRALFCLIDNLQASVEGLHFGSKLAVKVT
jgi:hypothetical protein